ncbi:hypothetical protein FX983_06539 [Pseudomonas frederiksbergensis]|uniref:Uncharacterized protein n=1 Tax=Pseudomonas frederiksbergensis TaxID=104087 RepID=A0A6L5BK72_9PSED|nr:hypothetical protein FX983_06539 [Pseudomonas frederiksbergensis]
MADQQFKGTLQQNRHGFARPHAEVDKVMGQAIGPGVEFTIRQALPVVDRRCRIGMSQNLRFKQPMHGLVLRIAARGRIEIQQHVLALGVRQNQQLMQRQLRRLFQRTGQSRQRGQHVIADPLRADLGQRQHTQAEAFAQVVHRQCQRVVGTFFTAQRLQTRPRFQRFGGRRLHGATVAIIEQRTEQRRRCRHPAATLGQCQRSVFMPEQRRQVGMRGFDAVARALPGQFDPQRQGVDEHAQGAIRTIAALHPAHQHRTEHHVLTSRNTAQHPRPRQVMQARGAHAQLPGLGAQAQAERGVDRQMHLFDDRVEFRHTGQTEWQGRFIDLAQHVAEKRLMRIATDTEPHLGHVVTKRHRGGQGVAFAEQEGLHFVLHQFQCRVIQGHVMEQQNRDPTLVLQVLGADQAHQRRAAHVQTMLAGVEAFTQLREDVAMRGVERQLFQRQGCRVPDHLHRLVESFPHHRSAQNVVTIDHALQGPGKVFEVRTLLGAEQRLQHVRVALLGGEVMVKNAFLQRRQRIDVLHIAGAAGHGFDDAVDFRLTEAGQRQHVRGDAERRAEPVTAISRHQRNQFVLVETKTVPQRAVQPFVIAQDHKVAIIQLKTDRVQRKNGHQIAELHRRTCCVNSGVVDDENCAFQIRRGA